MNTAGTDALLTRSISDSDMQPSLTIDKGLQEMGFKHSAKDVSRSASNSPAQFHSPAILTTITSIIRR